MAGIGIWHRLQSLFRPKLPPRAANDYATHLPALVALGHVLPVTAVLELGCGHYSTPAFLDRGAFPRLQRLASVETDPAWSAAVLDAVGGDPRLQLRTFPDAVAALDAFDLDSFDLVFVDNGTLPAERLATIRRVCRDVRRPVVVIHDFEFRPYREASRAMRRRLEFRAFHPTTGVLWNDAAIDAAALRAIHRFMQREAETRSPDDRAGWIGAFAALDRRMAEAGRRPLVALK